MLPFNGRREDFGVGGSLLLFVVVKCSNKQSNQRKENTKKMGREYREKVRALVFSAVSGELLTVW